MKSQAERIVTGPRSLRDPRSREYAIQTMQSLKRFLESKTLDAKSVEEELQRIEDYKHWEVCGYKNIDAYLRSEVGFTAKKLKARIAQDLAADPDLRPAAPKIHAGPGRGHKTVSNTHRFTTGSAARIVARLKRDHPEIAAQLAADDFPSARAAARAAGIKVDPKPLTELRRAWKRASAEDRATFRAEILDD